MQSAPQMGMSPAPQHQGVQRQQETQQGVSQQQAQSEKSVQPGLQIRDWASI